MTPLAAASPVRDLVRKLRDTEFPWTAATTYLNNASIGPIPERTRLALEAFNARRTAPHLLPDRELMASLGEARDACARLIGADTDEVALTPNTTTGINVAAQALLEPGDSVVLSDREFPANVYPWLAQRDRGIEVEIAPVTNQGFPDEDYLVERVADPRVKVLAVSFVQFANGFRADMARLSKACRANGTYFVVDAIQGLGAAPLDVRETPIDVLSTGGQKWLLSPWGTGFTYVRKGLIDKLTPAAVGWMAYEGTDDFTNLCDYSDTFRADARRFEVGTIAFQDHVGLTVSLGLLSEIGVATIAEHVRSLHEPILRWCAAHEVRIVSPCDDAHRSAILCIAPDDARDAHRRLKAAGVVCALREGAIRLSPHCYNTIEEMERVVDVLEEAVTSTA